MRAVLIAVVVLAGACDKEAPRRLNHFESFEKDFVEYMKFLEQLAEHQGHPVDAKERVRSFRGVYIGPPGVWIDRKLVATLAELDTRRGELAAAIDADVKMLPSIGLVPSVTLELRDEPASVAIAALRLFAGRDMIFDRRVYRDPDGPPRPIEQMCHARLRAEPTTDKTRPTLSILVDPDKLWLGTSRINEFYVIPDAAMGRDFEKLDLSLKEQRSSELFADRRDLEIGASAGTSTDVLAAFDLACKHGFVDIAILPTDQLSAVPQL